MNNMATLVLLLLATTWIAALIGAIMVVFFKKENKRFSSITLGFAAGIMLVAAFWHMMQESVYLAETYSHIPPAIVAVGGFLAGCLLILVLDKILNRIKRKREEVGGQTLRFKRSFMLAGSITLHKLPEGFAVGVLLGSLGSGFTTEALLLVVPVLLAIGLHNVPEGAVMAAAFKNEGMTRGKSFLFGQTAGFIEFLVGIAGFVLVFNVNEVLPYALAFAAGAMVWVAVHELIPEAQKTREKHPYTATAAIIAGIAVMLLLEIWLCTHDHSHHHHDHGHQHHHGHDHHIGSDYSHYHHGHDQGDD